MPIHEPVSVSAVATCQSEIDELYDRGPTDQPAVADVLMDAREPLSTSETISDETVREIHKPEYVTAKPSEEPILFTALKQRTPAVVREIDQVLDQVELTEFGPAEWPLRELATISVLTRHGISTEQVTVSSIIYRHICSYQSYR